MLDLLLANWALLVDNTRALFAQASVSARHHDSVDFASHADLAVVFTALVQKQLLLAAHHLPGVYHTLALDTRHALRMLVLHLIDGPLHLLGLLTHETWVGKVVVALGLKLRVLVRSLDEVCL